MLTSTIHDTIEALEKHYNYDAAYLHALTDISADAATRFLRMQEDGSTYRGTAPLNAWCAAALAGAVFEDCGPCVQIIADMAVEAGMKGEIVAALLAATSTDPEAQLGFEYGRALLAGSETLDDLRAAVESQWGQEALIALSFRAMSARNYPVLKRAMGYAKACQKIRVGENDVVVNPVLKAA